MPGGVAMQSILKALGLTIWGLVAIGLLAIFVFVGYEAAVRHRASSGTLVDESTSNDQSEPAQLGRSGGIASSAPTSRTNDIPHPWAPARTPGATRILLLDAIHNSKYESAIAYGQELADQNSAEPGDLSIVAQSYSSVGDCRNARLWAQRAQDAFQAAGVVPDGSLRRVISCCAELRNYELAIAAIERGLRKGGIVHLDEAYVYLGRAKQAVGDIEGARNAFSKLKDVPGISPRVLRLWTLYAETQLTNSENWVCSKMGRTEHESSSTSTNEQPDGGQ
jgi:tetratricopeptide (TPR) repeat protein